jgi:hypothetical protein
VEDRFSISVQTGPGAHLDSYASGRGLSRGESGRGLELTTHFRLAPRLKKWYSYTSTPPLGLRNLFLGEFYLYLFRSIYEIPKKIKYRTFLLTYVAVKLKIFIT